MLFRVFASIALLIAVMAASPAWSQDVTEIALTIQNNRFTPEEVRIKAGTPFVLVIANRDSGPEEFESKALRIEKVIPGGKTVRLKMPALKPGTYTFVGEYHEKTAQGRMVAE